MKKDKCIFILLLALSAFVLVLAGCENKNSRSWIENKISAVERVYPTKNLYDLFEEFPDGFTVEVGDTYDKDEKVYSRNIQLIGDPKAHTIKGEVTLTLLEKEEAQPTVRTIIDSSDLEYTRSGDFILANGAASAELFPYKDKGFLFQKLTLNKKVLSTFDLTEASYNWQSEEAYLDYDIKDKTIRQFFEASDDEKITMSIYLRYDFYVKNQYTIPIIYDINGNYHSENVLGYMEKDND